jgi:hypothetical protein
MKNAVVSLSAKNKVSPAFVVIICGGRVRGVSSDEYAGRDTVVRLHKM